MDPLSTLHDYITENNLWDKNISLKRNEYLKVSGAVETHLYYIISGTLKISILPIEFFTNF